MSYKISDDHELPGHYDDGKSMAERMTNWQRSQWARAGYPGLSRGNYEAEAIRPFWLAPRNRSQHRRS
jgi:hypothetical protein